MNLTKLFETQAALDEHIMQEHPELRGQNNLDWKLLALQVELGECANEWRGFKKWSKDHEPRKEVVCHACKGEGGFREDAPPRDYFEPCMYCSATGIQAKPLLEEYVDCLHFILSIGLEIKVNLTSVYTSSPFIFGNDITKTFTHLLGDASLINSGFEETEKEYSIYVNHFLYLGEILGFSWEEVEEAYFKKNKVNHERQESGY
ncbi:dUTP diphosphatase [Lysinibacillus fusiformis]|uniref:dUTP diphosphatase n=1 Tax=Lysinibacillus fusiformis TaxID=28031 RepID=UPI00263AE9E4|nr:dUTP diphosphatase [Lysinibacillus fusiformis]MDC6268034.1 dUTP diphosphatase [Lysinibacillus sphaericus]MDN4967476.1 dUTP diphosphatase [Lysinibacillus fusiformis]